MLIRHFLANARGGDAVVLKAQTLEVLAKHDWPGNVRELRNVIDRAVLLREQPTSATSLRRAAPRRDRAPEPNRATLLQWFVPMKTPSPSRSISRSRCALPKQELIDEFERRYVGKLLEDHEYNLSAAARAAGTNRMTLHKIAERLGLRKRRE